MPIDGKVTNLNQQVASTLQRVQRATPGKITEAGANEIKKAILQDNKIDAGEQDLLDELTQTDVKQITVFAAGSNSPVAVTYPAPGKAKQILESTKFHRDNLDGLWNNGAEGFKQLSEIAARSPEENTRIVDFVASKLTTSWEQSNMGNRYQPLRTVISNAYGFAGSSGGDNVNRGRNILHAAMQKVDKQAGDSIPDFLYNWVRPGGLI